MENDTLQKELNRMYWHSRRGMLELDLILLPFVEQKLPQLSAGEQEQYRQLLVHEDQDLYAWLVGRASPPQELSAIVKTICGG